MIVYLVTQVDANPYAEVDLAWFTDRDLAEEDYNSRQEGGNGDESNVQLIEFNPATGVQTYLAMKHLATDDQDYNPGGGVW